VKVGLRTTPAPPVDPPASPGEPADQDRQPQQDSGMLLRTLPIVIAIATYSIIPALGQETRGAVREACLEDYKRLCSTVARGGGRIRKCMSDNSAKLSPPRRAALGAQTKPN
jgi:hypothetical protein